VLRFRLALIPIGFALLVALAAPAAAFDSDDFDRANLDPGRWTFENPLGGGWVELVGAGSGNAHLALTVPEGPSHDPYHVNRSVRVMQPIADADFELEAKFESDPSQRYQLQGFIVEADADNWLRFDTYHDGTTQRIFAAVTANGSSSSRFDTPIDAGAARLLRITRAGDLWTCAYSADGSSYTPAGSFSHALAVTSAGVFAANHASSGDSPAFTAVVDYVFDTAAPIADEDASVEPDTLPPFIHTAQTTMSGTDLIVSWYTDELALGTVDYGETTAYELGSISDSGGTTFHSVLLPGLVPGTTYHFRVRSSDGLAQESQTGDTEILFDPQGPDIEIFYGDVQSFGQLGQPQPWVNVLGNVSDPDGVSDLEYSLNGASPVSLTIGPDGRRLVEPGDFNVDLDVADLSTGSNTVEIAATDGQGSVTIHTVTVDYQPGTVWPLPYSVDWSSLAVDAEIQDVAQVVDGRWVLEGDEIRTADPGYDRLVAIGDRIWTDVEVTVPIVINASASSHGVGILLRWDGHTDTPVSCAQPKCGYLPLGAILWARPNRLEIYGNDAIIYDSQSRTLTPGVTYWFKGRVETQPQGSLYRLKVWEDGELEPTGWDLEGQGVPSDPQQGSVLLITHQADVSFGDVSVVELAPPQNFPPVANDDIAFVAPAGQVGIDVLANDTDYDGTLDPASVAVQDPPAHGVAAPDSVTGHVFYTHDGSAAASDSFTYTVDDAIGATSNVATVSVTVTANPPQGVVSDDFNRPELDEPLWAVDDPTGDGTFQVVGAGTGDAHLALSMPAGIPHNAWGAGGQNESIRVMQSVPNDDFGLEVKWNTEPLDGYNDQGILVEHGSNDWLRFDVFHDGSSLRLFVGKTIGGTNTAILNEQIPGGSAFYLRVMRSGDVFTTWTSGDGLTWELQNSFSQALTVARVGVYAANPIQGLAFTSEVDYFFNTTLPIANEDANTIAIEILGMGDVSLNPDLPEYALGAVVELSATPSGVWQFDGWSGDLTGIATPALLTITGSMRVTATFVEPVGECNDGLDNDDDGFVDTADPACSSGNPYIPDPTAPREQTQCQDGMNNDLGQDPNPGRIDFDGGASLNGGIPIADPDPQCVGKPWKNAERKQQGTCGLGTELALLLPPLMWLWRRRRPLVV
jgi:regulation of enolase protein 1 (concanavalin A-like superfamily)